MNAPVLTTFSLRKSHRTADKWCGGPERAVHNFRRLAREGLGEVPLINDIVYVPRDRADISIDGNGIAAGVGTPAEQDSVYALLDDLVRAETCLREQRDRILERNACRNPWFGTLNARLTKVVPTRTGQSFELSRPAYAL